MKFTKRVLGLSVGALCFSAAVFAAEDVAALVSKAKASYSSGDYRTTVIHLKNALQQSPQAAEARLLLGQTYLKMLDAPAAEQEFKKAIQQGASKSDVAPLLAQAYLMQGKPKQVLSDITLNKSDTPKRQAEILALQGDAHLMNRAQAEAEKNYKQALELDPLAEGGLLGTARLALLKGERQQAATFVEKTMRQYPNSADALVLNGVIAQQQGDKEKALQSFIKALKIEPANLQALLGKAELEAAGEKFDVALADVDQVLKFAPGHPTANYLKAEIHFKRKEFDQSKNTLSQVLKVAPNHLQSQLLLGMVHYVQGNLEQAEYYLAGFSKSVPNHLPARKALARVYLSLKKPQRAVETLDVAVEKNDKDAQLLALLGSAYLQAGESKRGGEYLQRAADIAPDEGAIRAQLGLSKLAAGNVDAAAVDLERAVGLDEDLLQADMLLVYTHLRQNDTKKAVEVAQALEKKQPNNPVAVNLLGIVLAQKGDFAAAKKQFEKALKVDPKFTTAYMELAQLALQEKKPAVARENYQKVLKTTPNHLGAMLAMGRLADSEGDRAGAISWIEKAKKANPDSIEPTLLLSNAYFLKGDKMKALSMAREAADAHPDHPMVLATLGKIQVANNDLSNATATFRKLVDLQPKSPQALVMLAEAQAANKQQKAATDSAKSALKLQKGFVPAQVLLAKLQMEQKQYDAARQTAKELQTQNPKLGVGFEVEGDVYTVQGDIKSAAKSYDAAFSRGESSALAVKLYRAREQLKQKDALEPLERQLVKEPNDATVRMVLAVAYQSANDPGKAMEQYNKILQSQPDNVAALNNLAWLYAEKGDKQAVTYGQKAYELAQQSPAVMDTYGWALIKTGQMKRGVDILKEASVKAPHLLDIKYHLAYGYYKSGDIAAAKKEITRLLENPALTDKRQAEQLKLDIDKAPAAK